MFSVYALHRRADLFPEPERFRPERFLDPAGQPDRYAYLPFGAGQRICLGNLFAMLEAQVILATMVQQVKLQRISPAEDQTDTVLTLRPKESLVVAVEKRKGVAGQERLTQPVEKI